MNQQAEVIETFTGQVVEFQVWESDLTKMEEENSKQVFDYASKDNKKNGKAWCTQIRKTKTALEQCRTDALALARQYTGDVNEKCKVLKLRLETMIDVHMDEVKRIEDIQKDRVRKIQMRLASFREAIQSTGEKHSQYYIDWLEDIVLIKIDDSWDEFEAEAAALKDAAMEKLIVLREAAIQLEANEAELETLRQENRDREEREAQDRQKREKFEREELERVNAQNLKLHIFTQYKTFPLNDVVLETLKDALVAMKEMDVTAEDWDSDFIDKARVGRTNAITGLAQMIIDKEAQIEQLAEFNRLKDEKQERENQEAIERDKKAEKERREADQAHRNKIHARIADAIGDMDRDDSPIDLVMEIADGNIPHLKIEY